MSMIAKGTLTILSSEEGDNPPVLSSDGLTIPQSSPEGDYPTQELESGTYPIIEC